MRKTGRGKPMRSNTQPIKRKAANLEREVINAVMILYAGISAAILAVHFWQPGS
jgi:hypothetical protein